MSEQSGREVFYGYMSDAEREAVEKTGMLRGGRGAGREETHWTDEVYGSALEAKALLAMAAPPRVRLAFRIKGEVALEKEGAVVGPDGENPGGGSEWMTKEAVEVEVIGYAYLGD